MMRRHTAFRLLHAVSEPVKPVATTILVFATGCKQGSWNPASTVGETNQRCNSGDPVQGQSPDQNNMEIENVRQQQD